jgi:hypothetical protein
MIRPNILTRYKIELNQYSENIMITSKCNAITFLNVGTTNVLINNITLVPNANLSIQGNANEIDVTEYRLDFGTNTAASGNLVQIIKKLNL